MIDDVVREAKDDGVVGVLLNDRAMAYRFD